MRIWLFVTIITVLSYNVPITDGTCELPTDLRGTWVDTFKGPLEFEASRITGYEFYTFGTLTLTCYQQDDTVYVMESTEFLFYGLNFTAYFCWNFTQVNTDMFYFYEYAAPVADAGFERAKVYLPALPRIYDSICANPDVGLGTYRILFRNGTIENAITDCPSQINGNYKYDVRDETGSSTCNSSSSNPLDACTNSSSLIYNGTDCSIPLAYSESGSVFCLFNVEDSGNKIHYMSLYNPGDVDETTTFSITCMILSYASSSLTATQYPRQCPDNMNTSYVTSPGAYVYLNSPSSCTASSAFPWWVIGVAFAIILLIAAIIIFLYYRKRKQKEKEKQRLLQQEDDERFDPEKFARGDRPPFVSITIMGDGRRRDKDGNIIPDEPPVIKRPKSEGGKRRLDKRKRVWVIDKDGQVKKVWKESGESPDSGLEEDEVDGEGGGSTGRKTLSSARSSEKDEDDFSKKHGRKELKSAREIEEKGEKDKNSAKLMRKMKGMVSARRSARFRKSARSGRARTGRKKSAPYSSRDDDGDRSWGSDEGDYEEVDMENIQEMDDNMMNEEREKLGDDVIKPSKDQLDVAPAAAVAVVSETKDKEGGKGRKGKKDKGKQKAGKEDSKKKSKTTSGKESKTKKDEELLDQPSASGVVATAVVVDETAKEKKTEKETSKKPREKTARKKKEESKQTRKAADKKVSPGKSVEHIEMEDRKEVKFKDGGGGDGKISKDEAAAIGAGATAAGVVAADSEKSEKTEAQLKAEQKKKDKEDAKRLKEEKKRLEKEEKEAKKKAEAEAKEKERALKRYASVEEPKEGETENVETTETKDEEIIPSPKKDELKPSGTDSGHVTPTSAEDVSRQDESAPSSSRQETTKPKTDARDEKPPLPPSREPTLSSSMRPRREQSVLLELDQSRSGSAGMTGEKRDFNNASPGQGQKSLNVVEELVDTARSKAEGLNNTLDESIVAAAAVPLLDLSSKDNDSIKDTAKSDTARGDEVKEEKKGKETGEKKTVTEKKEVENSKTGAKTTDKNKDVKKAVQIHVNEADTKSKTDAAKRHDIIEEEEEDGDGSSDDSSEPDVPVVTRKRPQQFMFMDPSGVNNAFKQAGDVLHSMPVKKKGNKRKPRAAPVDIATTLPQRTNAAFGVSDKQKPKGTTAARGRTATTKPASASKGPMTIKDISKKPPTEQFGKSPRREPIVEGGDSSRKSGQSSNVSRDLKDRKTSEVDPGQHLKLMTRLMSLAEGDEPAEGGSPSRAQSGKSRQSRLDRAESSARARAEEAARIDAEPDESLDTPDALITARQGPILQSLPPTQHVLSRASSAGTRARSGISRSHSDNRQAFIPPQDTTRTRDTHSSSSTNSEDRFVRFKQGVMKQLEQLGDEEMNAIMYPRVQRYPEEGGPKRGTPAYRSVGTLQRIHRRNNKVGPFNSELPPIHGAYGRMIDDYDDTDDPRLKVLLEELYKDKKYMDKTLRENPEENDFIRSRTMQGRSFLLNRARFWSTQQPLVRPGTQATSRASTAMPPPFPGEYTFRTRSEERPGETKKD